MKVEFHFLTLNASTDRMQILGFIQAMQPLLSLSEPDSRCYSVNEDKNLLNISFFYEDQRAEFVTRTHTELAWDNHSAVVTSELLYGNQVIAKTVVALNLIRDTEDTIKIMSDEITHIELHLYFPCLNKLINKRGWIRCEQTEGYPVSSELRSFGLSTDGLRNWLLEKFNQISGIYETAETAEMMRTEFFLSYISSRVAKNPKETFRSYWGTTPEDLDSLSEILAQISPDYRWNLLQSFASYQDIDRDDTLCMVIFSSIIPTCLQLNRYLAGLSLKDQCERLGFPKSRINHLRGVSLPKNKPEWMGLVRSDRNRLIPNSGALMMLCQQLPQETAFYLYYTLLQDDNRLVQHTEDFIFKNWNRENDPRYLGQLLQTFPEKNRVEVVAFWEKQGDWDVFFNRSDDDYNSLQLLMLLTQLPECRYHSLKWMNTLTVNYYELTEEDADIVNQVVDAKSFENGVFYIERPDNIEDGIIYLTEEEESEWNDYTIACGAKKTIPLRTIQKNLDSQRYSEFLNALNAKDSQQLTPFIKELMVSAGMIADSYEWAVRGFLKTLDESKYMHRCRILENMVNNKEVIFSFFQETGLQERAQAVINACERVSYEERNNRSFSEHSKDRYDFLGNCSIFSQLNPVRENFSQLGFGCSPIQMSDELVEANETDSETVGDFEHGSIEDLLSTLYRKIENNPNFAYINTVACMTNDVACLSHDPNYSDYHQDLFIILWILNQYLDGDTKPLSTKLRTSLINRVFALKDQQATRWLYVLAGVLITLGLMALIPAGGSNLLFILLNTLHLTAVVSCVESLASASIGQAWSGLATALVSGASGSGLAFWNYSRRSPVQDLREKATDLCHTMNGVH